MPQKLCLAGKNRIAVETLDILRKTGLFELSVCPVQSDSGIDTWQPSLKSFACNFNIPIVQIEDIYDENSLVFLSVEFDKIIESKKFKNARLLNIHFSLLPSYKGCFTSIWPLYFDEKQSGVTFHFIDDGIDTGDIIDQSAIDITPDMNARELYEKYQDAGRDLLKKYANKLSMKFELNRTSQPATGLSYFSRNSLSKISNKINVWATAAQINNQVRALFFPEYQTTIFNDIEIRKCEITSYRSIRKPGSILKETKISIEISTIDFDIVLYKHMVE